MSDTKALAEWFDGFVGSDEERSVADALIEVVAAAQALHDELRSVLAFPGVGIHTFNRLEKALGQL